MTLAAVTDHVERGLGLLLGQYRDKPRMRAWVRSFLSEVQELSDATWGVLVGRLIDDATDAQLDVLGDLVGQVRTSSDDEIYRAAIRVRIRVNRSHGRANDIQEVSSLLFDGAPWRYTEYHPASVIIDSEGPLTREQADLYESLLQDAKPAGVALDVHFTSELEATTLQFASGDVQEVDAARGLGNDAATTGGGFVAEAER